MRRGSAALIGPAPSVTSHAIPTSGTLLDPDRNYGKCRECHGLGARVPLVFPVSQCNQTLYRRL